MKQIKIFLFAFLACMVLTACPAGGDDASDSGSSGTGSGTSGNTYQETINLPAKASEDTYTLSKLKSKITSATSAPSWLTITTEAYTSGSPKIKVVAKENTEYNERKCSIVVTAENNDKLTLTIIQAAKEKIPDGIEDVHGVVSPKPSYVNKD